MTVLEMMVSYLATVPGWIWIVACGFPASYAVLDLWRRHNEAVWQRGVRDGIMAIMKDERNDLPPWPPQPPTRGRT